MLGVLPFGWSTCLKVRILKFFCKSKIWDGAIFSLSSWVKKLNYSSFENKSRTFFICFFGRSLTSASTESKNSSEKSRPVASSATYSTMPGFEPWTWKSGSRSLSCCGSGKRGTWPSGCWRTCWQLWRALVLTRGNNWYSVRCRCPQMSPNHFILSAGLQYRTLQLHLSSVVKV